METTVDLAPTAAEVARVVSAVRDDQLGDPTPCTGTSVAALLDHMVGLTLAFRLAAEKTPLGGAPSASAEHLPGDWRAVIPRQLDELVEAWRQPGAWTGEAEAGGVRMPAPTAGAVALNEVLVHGWDLAAATGQPYRADAIAAQACLDLIVQMAALMPEARDANYGPVVGVPPDAPVFEQLLGQTGRDPGWRPAG